MPHKQKFARKLRAILSADVKGYSILMSEDELFTIQTLKEYREIMSNCILQYAGRVVDSPGDNVLAEFASALNAVECAVKVQTQLKKENDRLPEAKRMEFRIGVNIGDIVQDEDRIYGSGVNIAARIEGLTDPSGVCISRNTYHHVKDKLDLKFEFLGEHEVKNIKEPVGVYKVLLEPSADNESITEGSLEIPDRPSIAVLPFNNMSGDPNQDFFSDGLTEQIITGISKIPSMFVIARNSSFTYKNKAVKVQQVAQELGVQYVLEGSVQKSGDRVRINAQLIDATTGHHLWAESYDSVLEDIFAIQDDITIKLMNVLHDKLIALEALLQNKGRTENINAYIKFLQGLECFFRMTDNDNFQAQKCFMEATDIDRNYSISYAMLAWTHLNDVFHSWSKSPLESFAQAKKMAKEALSQVESLQLPLIVLSQIYLFERQHDKAIEYGKRSVALNPNNALAHAMIALVLYFSGRPEKAIVSLDKAFRLNPVAPFYYFHFLGHANMMMENYTEAVQAYNKAINVNSNFIFSHICLAACYNAIGNEGESLKAKAEIFRLNPKFTLDAFTIASPHKDPINEEKVISLLRNAGLE